MINTKLVEFVQDYTYFENWSLQIDIAWTKDIAIIY